LEGFRGESGLPSVCPLARGCYDGETGVRKAAPETVEANEDEGNAGTRRRKEQIWG